MTPALAALVILLPFAAGTVGLLTGRLAPGLARPLAVLPTALSAALAVVLAVRIGSGQADFAAPLTPTGGWSAGRDMPISLAFHLDGLATLTAVLVGVVATCVQIYSTSYLRDDPRYRSYAAVVSFFTSAMLLVVLTGDLVVLMVGWEVMGICSYLLIGHHWEKRDARSASLKAFLVTKLGDVPFLFGLFLLAFDAGTFRIDGVLTAAVNGRIDHPTLAALLLLAGAVGKSAQFPLHTWLPDAMAGPTPVSALIHAATMVAAGIYLIARLHPVFLASGAALLVLAVLAAITMIGSALCALAQDDVKRVLAYSTVGQLGYMAGALACGDRDAAAFHLLTHGAFKALLFLSAGVLIHAAGTNSLAAMSRIRGLRHRAPDAFWCLTIGLLALAGIPPFSGFFSKDAVLAAAEHATSGTFHAPPTGDVTGLVVPAAAGWTVLLSGLLTALLTAAYATRLWLLAAGSPTPTLTLAAGADSGADSRPQPVENSADPQLTAHQPTHQPAHQPAHQEAADAAHEPPAQRWPLWALAVPSFALGLAGLNTHWLPALLDQVGLRPATTTAVPSLACAVLGVLAGWGAARARPGADPGRTLLGPLHAPAVRGFYVDAAYSLMFVRPVLGAARLARFLDADVVETYVRGTAATTRGAGAAVRRAQTGNIQTYLGVLLAGAVVIGILVVV
ncbi:NADH dehydrogenase [Mangrovactinospora gilvigrisea]|uniref:NADH dehydrogenase n=1 Tax=Mangrovactinospora gilvigrisea TaxID=1428644 RepID=A0A1J7CCM0_9ACTN|nr:NADH-quinone oxidoreductase subunit L [Mangrovactinospora gilvigrisea]OIV39284.1 NADH dehydrogenase [Mangrovactinospora gilvigrisea]